MVSWSGRAVLKERAAERTEAQARLDGREQGVRQSAEPVQRDLASTPPREHGHKIWILYRSAARLPSNGPFSTAPNQHITISECM